MSRKVIKIPQAKQNAPIGTQQLRVAAYCRVSTRHEEQYHSLEAQIAYHPHKHKDTAHLANAGCATPLCGMRLRPCVLYVFLALALSATGPGRTFPL